MTSTPEDPGEIFKRDTKRRVRVPRARREMLLDEMIVFSNRSDSIKTFGRASGCLSHYGIVERYASEHTTLDQPNF